MKGGRKASPWNLFVKKIYHEGHNKNKTYSFKQALQDASKRKGEMTNVTSKKPNGKTRKNGKKTGSRKNH